MTTWVNSARPLAADLMKTSRASRPSALADIAQAAIKNVAKRVVSYKKKGYDVVVVVSALGDTTDEVLKHLRRLWGFKVRLETVDDENAVVRVHECG